MLQIEIDYSLSDDITAEIKASKETGDDVNFKKMQFTGYELELKTLFGSLTIVHPSGDREFYEGKRMVVHFPAEHYITDNG